MRRLDWRRLKQAPLHAMKSIGAFNLVLDSAWRARRLLILCYHGVSIDDEHEWNGLLYVPPDRLRRRLELLRDTGCTILPLQAALDRLYGGTLPPRAVALTFDDGFFDFVSQAYPLLREFDAPATVYLTTQRCERNYPVFGLMCSYVLWKARGRVIEAPEFGETFDLRTPEGRARAQQTAADYVARVRPTIPDKDAIIGRLAERCGIDYAALAARRLLTIMTPHDVSTLAAAGVDFELHTHTHTTPGSPQEWAKEIQRNRASIEGMTNRRPTHFCYPSGRYRREYLPSLAGQQVVSATTCDPGLASPRTNPLLLPRFVDACGVSMLEFEGWVSGAATFVSRNRSYGAPPD